MLIKDIEFIGSYEKLSQCPKPQRYEYAFIGRSNVGKSSLINMLAGRKAIAKVSGKPGKTRTINYFLVNSEWYLVDLPGYGYAQVSKKERKKFAQMIESYLYQRESLCCTFVLIDARVPPQQSDLEFINQLGSNHVPFALIFTKIDKLKPKQLKANVDSFNRAMKKSWEVLPDQFYSSAISGAGREEILNYIEEVNLSIQ